MDHIVFQFIFFLQQFSSESLSLLTLLICSCAILVLLRYFGAAGLYVYNATAIIVGNIQVLRLAKFGFSAEPVALGTVAFATTFLVTDILTEHYGPKAAKRALWLSFLAQILTTVLMIVELGHAPLPQDTHAPEGTPLPNSNYIAMLKLFTPSMRLLIASLLSYALSQLFDIWLFQKIRTLSHNRFVWLRQNVSTIVSGLLDNFVFSVIAWVLLSSTPMPFHTLIFSYVLGTYFLRLVINICSTPVMYLSYHVIKKNESGKDDEASLKLENADLVSHL